MTQRQDQPVIRPITEADVPAAVDTLTRAFTGYPYIRHVLAADGHEERIRRLHELQTRTGMAYGRVWVAEDCRAVAVWHTPDQDLSSAHEEIGRQAVEILGDRLAALVLAEQAVEPHLPQEPTWFLDSVGVAPDSRGRGLGRAVLAPGMAAAAREGRPAFLATATERNVRFYEGLGFRVTAELALPGNGPRTWCMRKDPGPRTGRGTRFRLPWTRGR
ncbi:GNAT family N-acetyltransferase [Kitasatospora sp. NPDC056184]|uniref:GNAT family N-acetyltransferase n=1 Tax=Kitasatospora sp. NPDC056184 TaxID=3345738 RepID=UPI0035E06072